MMGLQDTQCFVRHVFHVVFALLMHVLHGVQMPVYDVVIGMKKLFLHTWKEGQIDEDHSSKQCDRACDHAPYAHRMCPPSEIFCCLVCAAIMFTIT